MDLFGIGDYRDGDTAHAWFWSFMYWVVLLTFVGGAVVGFVIHGDLKDQVPANPDTSQALTIALICSGAAIGLFILRRVILWLLD